MAENLNDSNEPQMAQKSLQTMRERNAKAQGAQIEEHSPRSDSRAPRVQMPVSLSHQMMVKSSGCRLK
jgi:hypothetical protein